MAIPELIDYSTPKDLPKNRAPWRLDRSRAAVLVHDMQRYFLRSFSPECPALGTALAGSSRVLAAARRASVPVFYTAQRGDEHPDIRGLQGDFWGPGMSADPQDTEIVLEVSPQAGEPVLEKHRYSAFVKSDLAERIGRAGRDQLIIVGVYAHIGVTATAFDAFQRGVQPFVVADAVADFSHDDHARALRLIADCCGSVASLAETTAGLADAADSGSPADVRTALDGLLAAEVLQRALDEPESDLFSLGLDSVRAFEMLDRLAEADVDIDFGEFTRRPSVAFLYEQGAARSRS